MGCFISKPEIPIAKEEKQWAAISPNVSPFSRTVSISTPLVHHPPLRKGDSNHLVSLTSTSYGSLQLVGSNGTGPNFREFHEGSTLARESIEMKMVSLKREENQRKSLSPDSVINTWELMEGLDDYLLDEEKQCDSPAQTDPTVAPETMGSHLSVSPTMQEKELTTVHFDVTEHPTSESRKRLSDADNEILLYFTSLRGVRKTYEDCHMVRLIFQGFRVHVDERDISMDSTYKTDLQNKLKGKKLSLPRVFIRGEHIGGAEEIKQLNENGELAKLLEGFPVNDGFGSSCGYCGEVRFVPCPCCSGSRKVFDKESGIFRRCMDCNENGLIPCPSCCS
ncbi:hypothetical protein MLD38_031003 [Melastoma candidum]|uniref:Uncharacterized protein n=1 Tax=Melastoma candidum TaxID=119954 RepID=A0ACB9MRW4_9MYRT|nr:hypothetical protein MLD38_031003 [Melastoma candidum]